VPAAVAEETRSPSVIGLSVIDRLLAAPTRHVVALAKIGSLARRGISFQLSAFQISAFNLCQ